MSGFIQNQITGLAKQIQHVSIDKNFAAFDTGSQSKQGKVVFCEVSDFLCQCEIILEEETYILTNQTNIF
jgi:hypothetical protein